MRLLILSSEFPPGPGGIGTHAYELARQLQQLGWEVSVVASQDYVSDQEVSDFNSSQSFPIVRWESRTIPAMKAILRRRAARAWIKDWKPDLIVASGQRATWIAASLRCSQPLIVVGHGSEFGVSGSWNNKLTRWAFQRSALVVCVSEYTRRQMVQVGIQPRNVRVITNGADHNRFEVLAADEIAATRESLGLENAQLLITVGNVTERKGQNVVIRALPKILESSPNVHYLIAGLPTLKNEFLKVADELGVADHVHFLGRVDNRRMVSLVNAADVFVMTSRFTGEADFEGFGIAAVEAALCGKPAVVSGDSGLAEAVVDGVTGVVVPQNDQRATAAAIISLVNNRDRREEMGSAARKRALTEQTWEHSAKLYDTALRSVVPMSTVQFGKGSEAKGVFSN